MFNVIHNVPTISLKWYSLILIVVPSLISTLISSFIGDTKTHLKKELYKNTNNNVFLVDIVYLFVQIICYIVITAIAIFFYAVFRYFSMALNNVDITVFSIWRGFAFSHISSHWVLEILIPCIMALLAKGLKNNRWNGVLCCILSVVLLVSSLITNSGAERILPLEAEILSELKSNPIYDYSILNIDNFQNRIHTGYTDILLNFSIQEVDDSEEIEQPSELNLDINTLNIKQLVKCFRYLHGRDQQLFKLYVDKAYELYLLRKKASHWDAGNVLYYYAGVYNSSFYWDAALEFEKGKDYWNAALSLMNYYVDMEDESNDIISKFVDDSILALNYEQYTVPMTYCEDVMIHCYEKFRLEQKWPVEEFDRLCEAFPNEALLNIMNASVHISLGEFRELDEARIDHLITLEKYRNCPKALLLSQYYGNEHLNELYQLHINHPEWFEKEDQMNLAWLFYERGENQLAISITNDTAGDVLIRTESFLQSPNENVNLDLLYADIANAIDKGAGEYESRLRLAQVIIGNRLGIEVSYKGLSERCSEAFNINSTTGMFIVSSLNNIDGRYEEAYLMTERILEKLSAPDSLYYRTLFLQAEALMGMASMADNIEESSAYYENAAIILETVRDSMEGDYVACLERLVDVYQLVGRDEDMNSTLELLVKIKEGS